MSENDARPVYLDHNATTPVHPDVVQAMLPYLREHFGNPSSGHAFGARAAEAVALARHQVASLLGAEDDEIVFTSGGTEANNLAIFGVIEARVTAKGDARRNVVTTTIEHPATEMPCRRLEARGLRVSRVPVDGEGRARVDVARSAIDGDTALVTVMHSNNETGVLQPIDALTETARDASAFVHTDAAQSIGKVRVRVDELDVDLLSVAGHKLYAPKGVGALFVRRGTPLAPFALGAGHEGGRRPGTENVASIVGLGAACAIADRDLEVAAARMVRLRDSLHERLAAAVPGLTLNGAFTGRLPNTLNVRFPVVSGTALLAAAPTVAASTGSACHDGGDEQPSAVICAMGVSQDDALGSVRLTLGRGTTDEDIERASSALIAAFESSAR